MSFNFINPPRQPTAEERTEAESLFPHIGEFLVLGEATPSYNCLGFGIGTPQDLRTGYLDHLDTFLDAVGLQPSEKDSPSTTIDVWYKDGQVCHVSRRWRDKWASKLGKWLLVIHDREAIRGIPGYGELRGHWAQKSSAATKPQAGSSNTKPTKPALAAPREEAASMDFEAENITEEEISSVREHAITALALPKRQAPGGKPKTAPSRNPPKTNPANPTHTTTPAKTNPPKTNPPKTNPPKTNPPKTNPPKTNPPKTNPPKTGNPAPGSPKFEDAYTQWKKTWDSPEVKISSFDVPLTTNPAFKALVKLGPPILPQLAAKLTVPGNDWAVYAYAAIDKTWRSKHPKPLSTSEMKAAIVKGSAASNKRIAANVNAFTFHKDSVISAGLNGAAIAAQLMTDPIFLAIVREGSAAAVHILEAEAKDESHHSGIWAEMLRQIHTIEQHGTAAEQKQEFEHWLDSYLSHSTTPTLTPGEDSETSGGEATPDAEEEEQGVEISEEAEEH
ncbi:hypothetical protein GQ53DRAFT_823164 [Thozetella sp. PMI_491]|nr:hypothetical protein GQ53DRAFT_823164 [Thozetella sp. PMI_491]